MATGSKLSEMHAAADAAIDAKAMERVRYDLRRREALRVMPGMAVERMYEALNAVFAATESGDAAEIASAMDDWREEYRDQDRR